MKSKFVGTNQYSNKTLEERFWEKVDIRGEDDCWEWQGSRHWQWDYGNFKVGDKVVAAHRMAWFIFNEKEIPEGLVVCHKCDNPPCCNPKHLFLGTVADNNMDKKLKGRQDERGEKNGRAKISEKDVVDIRAAHKSGETYASLGRRYNLDPVSISYICTGRNWSHIKDGL